MQSDDRTDERSKVDDEHVVVGVSVEGLDHSLLIQVRKQIEDVLDLIEDGVVDGELSINNVLEVLVHLLYARDERFQRVNLVTDLSGEGRDVGVANVAQKMFNSDFLSLKRLNCRRNVLETMSSLAVLEI